MASLDEGRGTRCVVVTQYHSPCDLCTVRYTAVAHCTTLRCATFQLRPHSMTQRRHVVPSAYLSNSQDLPSFCRCTRCTEVFFVLLVSLSFESSLSLSLCLSLSLSRSLPLQILEKLFVCSSFEEFNVGSF